MEDTETLRADAVRIFRAALERVRPEEAVLHAARSIPEVGESVRGTRGRVAVVAAGKASAAMAGGFARAFPGTEIEGLVVAPVATAASAPGLEILEAGHPLPDDGSVRAGERALALAGSLGGDDLLVFLLSGGASALLALPAEGVDLAQKREITSLLLRSGATIREMNSVRKHLSRLKGGGLASAAFPARVISLILSDIVGDPIPEIGSGPTAADPTTFADALAVLEERGILDAAPEGVRTRLRAGAEGRVPETPKPGAAALARTRNIVVASLARAIEGAADEALRRGYAPFVLSSAIEGEAREIGRVYGAILSEIRRSGRPVRPPACLLAGGEPTVTVRGPGKGGRSQELALAAAETLDGASGVLLLAAGTDGRDGPTEAAGAFASGDTAERARKRGLSIRAALRENDAHAVLHALGDLLVTGPTGTNVMDLHVGIAR
jgi:hydroxypyruvate reductase